MSLVTSYNRILSFTHRNPDKSIKVNNSPFGLHSQVCVLSRTLHIAMPHQQFLPVKFIPRDIFIHKNSLIFALPSSIEPGVRIIRLRSQNFYKPLDKFQVQKTYKGTWTPLLARNCLKSASFKSPTKTDLCGGAEAEMGSKNSMSFSVFPTSASTQAIS